MISEAIVNNNLEISDGRDTLIIPLQSWGHPAIIFGGNRIPASRIWNLIGESMKKGEKTDRNLLLEEARRSEIFRQVDSAIIIHTYNPIATDAGIMGNVYARKERQRVRVLVDRFNIKIAKADGELTPEVLAELLEACETLGLFPCGMADDQLYICKDPETVFSAFGSRSWQRIQIFARRPSASSVPLDLN